MNKIGIMGGTFNPIHLGHLFLAEYAYGQLGLDRILFMPSSQPPHKEHSEVMDAEYREFMVKMAIRDNPHFEYSDIELRRKGNTYTADTLEQLTKDNPDTEYYFIIGADSLMKLAFWREPDKICKLCTLVAAGRDHFSTVEMEEQAIFLKETYDASVVLLDMPTLDISSSEIRRRIKENKSVRYYLTWEVHEYIREQGLYRDISLNELREKVKHMLTDKRYLHTLGVEEIAWDLALIYGCDIDKVRIAAILHDCAKNLTPEKLLEECKRFGFMLTETQIQTSELLHSKVGAAYAGEIFGIHDQEVLDAIYYHTTGRAEMSLLEKIIFVADNIEPNRHQFEGLETARRMAYEDLDQTVAMISYNTLAHLERCGWAIDPVSRETYAYYKKYLEGPQ